MQEALQKRAVNASVSVDLLAAAKEAQVNISALLELALIRELARLKRDRWREANLAAIAVYNAHLASHGACFDGRLDE